MAENVCGDVESRSKVSFVEGEKGSSTSVLSEFCSCCIPLAIISEIIKKWNQFLFVVKATALKQPISTHIIAACRKCKS